MTSREKVLEAHKKYGKLLAEAVQAKSDTMTGTEMYEEESFIPDFKVAVAKKNMLERKAGFLCKSSAGRIVKLIQPYDSKVYTGEPEEYPALWGFKWSTNPKKAKPFVAISTSPYNTGDCCIDNDEVYRSNMEGNVHAPSTYPQGWDKVTM